MVFSKDTDTILVAVLAVGVAVVSALIAWSSARQAKIANTHAQASVAEAKVANGVAVLADFLREFRNMEPARRLIIRELPKVPVAPLAELDDEFRVPATQVCFYLDALGLLVRRGLVDKDPVYSILGKPIERSWERLAPFIEAERARRDEKRYMRGFEDLAAGAREFDYDTDIECLRRYPEPKSDGSR
jgi:hypothetical protein